jgi:hypothetical protein
MAMGNDPAVKKRHQAKNPRQASSPNKVYQSRASKPSGVAAMSIPANMTGTDGSGGAGDAAPLAATESRLDNLEAKVNELLAALKK